MCKKTLETFVVVTFVAMLLLSNLTATAVFNNVSLDETENTKIMSNDSLDSLTFPVGGINLNSKLSLKGNASPFAFKGLWGLDDFAKNTFGGIDASFSEGVNSNHYVADGDSVQLIIGVDYTKSWAYENIANAVANGKGRIVNTVSLKGKVIAVVADVPLNAVSSFMEQMSNNPSVRYVEPNMKRQALLEPNDINWTVQWGPKKIEANWAWNTTLGSSDIIVAVVDTGVDYTHPDLAGNYIDWGYDWVNDDPDPKDDFGHGTHCAGIIAAVINNGLGIAGLAQVKFMAEKVLDSDGWGTDVTVANGIIHATDYGAKIISLSLGGYGYSRLLHEAVKYAYENGVLLVAAAGNGNVNLKLYPAAYEEVIAVAATDQNDLKAFFSNWGDWIELAAPGVNIYSTMPTYYVTLNDYGYSMNYSYMSGTSMACPHVAGTAALIWSQYRDAVSDWVRVQLRYTAEDLGDSGFDKYYGYGRINAKNTVEQAPPEHDLLIFDWDRPQYITLGKPTTFNVTVLNFGASNETDVEVELLVNDSLIDSASISFLQGTTSITVGLLWTPTSEGIHNVTYYIVPVANETTIENNQISEILYVITPPPETNWKLLATDQDEGVGTNLKAIYGQVYSSIVYFKVEHYRSWTTIDDIDTAIFIDADQNPDTGLPDKYYPYQDTDIGADFVIIVGWEATEMWKWDPVIKWWDIFNPIPLAYLEAPENSNWFIVGIFLSDIETGGLIDCAVADVMSYWDWMPDSGHFTLLVIQYEHELAVLLDAPQYLLPGEHSVINAAVYNNGLNNETNVEIQLIINGSIVASVMVPELVNGTCYAISFPWTPIEEGIYNVTAYAPPVPEENFTKNNIKTKFVGVHYPLINPEPGQYANYTMSYYDSYGNLIQQGYFNLTYEYYIEPYKIYVTAWQKDPYGYIYTGYMIVNTMNRFVEEGIWYGLWYPGWIETNIDIGSTINLLEGTATVTGTRIFVVGSKVIDCWEISYSMYGYLYTFWYDKQTGLWIGMNSTNPYTAERIELFLINTNVPIGVKYEHDLGVTLEAPLRLQPGESSMLNATVYNLGLNNESDIEVQLLINGTVVKSQTISFLQNGTSYTFSYLWTPTIAGKYNVTVYAPPVQNENITRNNVYSKIIPVQYAPKILAYVQYTDYYYDYKNTLKAIESAFGPNYEITELWDYTQLDSELIGKDILLIPDQEYASLYIMQRIGSLWSETLNEFLENGGIIILCDGFRGYGGTYGILTGAGLMSISSTNYRSYYTLYLVDPSDPLAEGVSQTFISPYYTVSFVTQETKVVVNDGVYPVVIRKKVGRGQIVLLGFDFESSNNNTELLLGNAVALTTYITISLNPLSGSPGTKVTVTGTRATANGNVSIYWDGIFVANTTANDVGNFSYILTVPEDAATGTHEVRAMDTATRRMASAPFRVIMITLNPSEGPVGTKVTVQGKGFTPQTYAPITFNDMQIGYAYVDAFGNFIFIFNVPISTAEMQIVKAFEAESYASATFKVLDVTPLNVQIDVGVLHFNGEIAEFYSQIVFKGTAVNATKLTAILYNPNGETVSYSYPENITLIATGLYKILYNIPITANTGTYTLVITANYVTDTIQACGTSFKSFLVSDTLTLMNNKITEIRDGIATVQTDLGFVKLNLTAMNVTLENIFLKVIAINDTTATIQTTIGVVNGTVTEIESNIATIVVPGLGQIQTDVSKLIGAQEAWTIPQYLVLVFSFVAAISAVLSVALLLKLRKFAKT